MGAVLKKWHWCLCPFSLVPDIAFEYWRCSLIIIFTLPSLMFRIPDNSRTVIRLFSQMSASTRPLFSPVTQILGRCSWGSFSTVSLPFLNTLLYLQTLTFDSVFSPYCLFNLEQISEDLQPSFISNLIIVRCSTLTCTGLKTSLKIVQETEA
jgi:hypothetical protein